MKIEVIKTFKADEKVKLEEFKKQFVKVLGFPAKVKYGVDPTGVYPESIQVYSVYLEKQEEIKNNAKDDGTAPQMC